MDTFIIEGQDELLQEIAAQVLIRRLNKLSYKDENAHWKYFQYVFINQIVHSALSTDYCVLNAETLKIKSYGMATEQLADDSRKVGWYKATLYAYIIRHLCPLLNITDDPVRCKSVPHVPPLLLKAI